MSDYFESLIRSAVKLDDADSYPEAAQAFHDILSDARNMALDKYTELSGRDVSELREIMNDLSVRSQGGL